MLDLQPHRDGVVLVVRAQPGSRSDGIRGEVGGALKVSVTTAPEKGKANKALVAVLSRQLGLRKSEIELLSGATSSQKRFLIRGMDVEQLRERINRTLPPQPSS